MIKSVDDNGDNEIDFEEFLILMSSKKPSSNDPDKELRDAFAVFDADGSGSISRTELKKLMKNLGQTLSDAELDAMMDEVDTDGNGEIDFNEFKSMMVSSCFFLGKYLYNFLHLTINTLSPLNIFTMAAILNWPSFHCICQNHLYQPTPPLCWHCLRCISEGGMYFCLSFWN